MTQANRVFPELARRLDHFSASTRARLSRSLVSALRGRRQTAKTILDDAVSDACRELRADGMTDQAIVEFVGALVEETGRACGADRPSLVSGELRWVSVHARVLQTAREALSEPVASTFLTRGDPNTFG